MKKKKRDPEPPLRQRRRLLQLTSAATALGVAIAADLFQVRRAWAGWPSKAFQANSPSKAVRELFGDMAITDTDKIAIDTVDLAEDGAVVPVKVAAKLPNVRKISLLADKNPVPWVASFDIASQVEGYVATRIKLAESTYLQIVAEAEGRLYGARKFIQVTKGGCS